ncbi:MAG: CBS domain-containing protein [Crocinitomicaceae bacterium]|nr:CBS domain-containing protein [Crocinitomicaceae bacterium]|tara:strand:- start:263 stop:925 length:663 start_codon:yes stop_codon:yes gene_type:complete
MLGKDLATEELPYLTLNDAIEKASIWMDEFKVSHLAVVDDKVFVGMISEDTILEISDWTNSIREHELSLIKVSAFDSDHLFELLNKFNEAALSVLAIVDENGLYIGSVNAFQFIRSFGAMSPIKEPGGIIELELNMNDYSLSEIAQIVESNGAKILGSFITPNVDSKKLNVTLKVNQSRIDSVLQTFERYQYNVVASFFESHQTEMIKDRYANLMRYLNI